MKPEARLFVMGYDGNACGPFRWTLVREWLAIGYFTPDDEVRPADGVNWRPISALPELLAIPPGDEINDAVNRLQERGREKKSVGPRASAYLKKLGCPVRPDRLNPHTAFHWVRILEELNPALVDRTEHWAAEEEAHGRTPAASPDHATGAQIEALRLLGREVPTNLTSLQAQRLISGPPTAEQLRRLKFYGLALPDGACKDEAAELIDRHMRGNWAAEEAYQATEREAMDGPPNGEKRRARLKLRTKPIAADGRPADARHSTPKAPVVVPPPARRSGRITLVVVGVVALGLVAAAVRWGSITPWAVGEQRPPVGGQRAADAPHLELVTVLQASDPARAEQLRTFAASLKFTGTLATAEPSAIVDGVAYRVGDVIDAARRIAIVDVDAANNALILTDASGSIVKRRLR